MAFNKFTTNNSHYGRDFSPGLSLVVVADMFAKLEATATPEHELRDHPDKKKVKKRLGEHYAEKVEVIIGALAKINATVPELFYMRMLRAQNVLTEELVHKFVENLEAFRAHAKSRNSEVAQFAASLLGYLNTHKFDPDNSLVGLEASAKTVQLCCGDESTPHTTSTAGSMIKLIGMSSGQLRSRRPFSEGDLVVLEVPMTNSDLLRTFKFARVISCATDDSCVVTLLSSEREPFQVRTKQVFALHPDIKRDFFQLRTMRTLVKDPFQEVLMSSIEKEIRSRLNQVLKDHGFDVDLLNQCLQKGSKGFGFSDLRRLKSLMAAMKNVENAPFLGPFNETIAEWAAKEAHKFVADVEEDKYAVFMPIRVSICKDIKTFPWTSLVRKRLVYAQAALDTALSDLYIMLKKIKDGKAKAELTAWWLDLIDAEITAFLKSRKYAFDMYPSDYTAQPPAPTSIGPIKFNLELIREILNRHVDKHQTRDLINKLKAQIYPRIDEFIENCLFTIAEYVPGVEISRTRVDIAQLQQAIEAAKPSLDAENLHWIQELVKDLKYLLRMYELEDSGEKVLDVVPVSGLILSYFYRCENELKTVLELWEGYLVEQEKVRGTRNYERLKTKIYTWNVTSNAEVERKIETMKEFGGTSCIRQLATGAFFSAALTEHGEIFTWGRGRSGELGLGDKKMALEPTLVEALTHKKVIQIGCGGAQTAAVTEDGQLYCWGWLPHRNQTVLLPSLVEEVASLQIRQVAVASQHILVLTQSEEVWAWGRNEKGQLGIGNTKDKDKPTLIEALRGKRPVLIRADGSHSAVITAQGELYIWGQNDDGMLGVGVPEPAVLVPTRVPNLLGKTVTDCALGSRQNVALTDAGEVYVWGPGFGITYVEDLGTARAQKIACGQTFVLVQTSKEEVCMWTTPSMGHQKDQADDGNPYQLRPSNSSENVKSARGNKAAPLPPVTSAPVRLKLSLEFVDEIRGKNVLQLCCGSVHAAVLVENPAFFGVSLEHCMQREKGRMIPSVVQKLVGYLSKNLETEALFRMPGQNKLVAQLKSEFDRDEDVNLFRYKDAHVAATLLRNYLLALPEPLIPPAVHQQFMEAQYVWHQRYNVPLHVERIRDAITTNNYISSLLPTPSPPPSLGSNISSNSHTSGSSISSISSAVNGTSAPRPRSGEQPRSSSNAALLPFVSSGSLSSSATASSSLSSDSPPVGSQIPRPVSTVRLRPLDEIPPDPELLSSLYALIHSLPTLNCDLLLYLLNFFHALTLKSDKNKTTPLSLAIAISGCLFRRGDVDSTPINTASTAQLEEARAQKEKFERSLLLTNSVTAMLIANAPVLQEVTIDSLNKQADDLLTVREKVLSTWTEWSWKLVAWSRPKFRDLFLESNALERSLQRAASTDITAAEAEALSDMLASLLHEPPSNVSAAENAIISAHTELERLPVPQDDADVAHVIAVEHRRTELLHSLQASRAQLLLALAHDQKQLLALLDCLRRSFNTLTEFYIFMGSHSGTAWHRLASLRKLPLLLQDSEHLASWERRREPLEAWQKEAKRAYLDAVGRYASERLARLAQLNFTRKKVQTLLQRGGGPQADQMRERFMRLRDPLTKSYPGVVETLFKLGSELAPQFEQRVGELQTELFKLEALIADIGRTTL